MKNRMLCLLLTAAMILLLPGCTSSGPSAAPVPAPAPSENSSSAAESSQTTLEDDGIFRVGVFYYSFADAYIASMRPFLEGALDEAGVSYQIFDGGNNQITQNEQISMAVSSGYDLLIVNVVTSGYADVANAVIEKAGDIPVIFFNRAIEPDGEEGIVLSAHDAICFIGTDPPEAGHLQGQMIGDYLNDHYAAVDLNHDGVISYAMFKGEEANVEAIYRTRYSVEDANEILAQAGHPALSYFDKDNADGYQVDLQGSWSEQAAHGYMLTNLETYNEENGNMIELVICNNDDMAKGAILALESAGYNTGEPGATVIPVFGVDATQTAQELIAEGRMAGTVRQDAEGMANVICAVCVMAGEGTSLTDALSRVAADAETFSVSENLPNKLIIDYAPYTGQ